MQYRNIRILITFFILAAISGCDYDLDQENFKVVQPPSETYRFDLNLSSESDTIRVFNTTEFNYNINTYGLDIIKGHFSLKAKKWDIFSGTGKFTIAPLDYPAGYDTLSLTVYTNSGTGSIAEHFGAEGYLAEKRWLYLIDGRPGPVITASKSITNDRFLKIIWPECKQYNFQAYELTGSSNSVIFSITIKKADINYYIDSCFIGGTANYRVSSRVITNNQHTWGNTFYVEEPYPVLQFEDMGTDSLMVFWNRSKYNAKYRLAIGSKTIFESLSP